jgi:copper chaperone CopZ
MTHTYTINGMTCEGCVAKVKHQLLSHPDITTAEVSLAEKSATITTQRHLTANDLQKAIGVDTKYKVLETATTKTETTSDASRSWLATYKPLLLIAGFILGVSLLTANGSLHTGMNSFMAGFFLVFSFFKLLDIKGFATSYAMYDLLAIRVPVYGYLYPFIELSLGVAYLTEFQPALTNWVTLAIMGFSSLGVIKSVINNQKIQCACLGAVFNLPMSTVTIVEDLLMVAMAAYMLMMS